MSQWNYILFLRKTRQNVFLFWVLESKSWLSVRSKKCFKVIDTKIQHHFSEYFRTEFPLSGFQSSASNLYRSTQPKTILFRFYRLLQFLFLIGKLSSEKSSFHRIMELIKINLLYRCKKFRKFQKVIIFCYHNVFGTAH